VTKDTCPHCGHEVTVVNLHTLPILEAHDTSGRKIARHRNYSACTGSGMMLQVK
jgi:transposase